MDDPIETQLFNAWNKITGARLSLDNRPIDMKSVDYWYESPRFGVNVGFGILTIQEERSLPFRGGTTSGTIALGLIVAKGELKKAIERSLGGRANEELTNGLVLECYELIIKAFTSHYGMYYTPESGERFHIYEAEKRAFDDMWFRHRPRGVRPGAIAELDAKLVL